MKVKGYIKLKLNKGNYTWDNYFLLKVRFKEENQLFYKTKKGIVFYLEDIDEYDKYINTIVDFINDHNKILESAKNMVIKYYQDNEEVLTMNNAEKYIKEGIAKINKNKITFEMKIEK